LRGSKRESNAASLEAPPEAPSLEAHAAVETPPEAHASNEAHASTEAHAKAARNLLIPVPRRLGVFVFILMAVALFAGRLRAEIALSLLGAVFLVTLGYCFLATLLLGIVNQKKAAAASARMLTRQIRASGDDAAADNTAAGNGAERAELAFALNAPYEDKRFSRLPGILVRYELRITTKDKRRVRYMFDPDFLRNKPNSFPVPERGAYYSNAGDADRLMRFDALGFFQLSLFTSITSQVPADTGYRLLVVPKPAEPLPIQTRSGGEEQRNAPRLLRTDNLIDHRPYIPGDDPRRINWKLYGHAGDLFIREGEPQPPPHSRLVILLDTQVDGACYSEDAGRRAVDLLCESALAIAVDYASRGMEISVGYSGGAIAGGNYAGGNYTADIQELAALLAYPAAIMPAAIMPTEATLSAATMLPMPVEDRGVLILALPRERAGNSAAGNSAAGDSAAGDSALDQFLRTRSARLAVDLVFLYSDERLTDTAETCARLYGQKSAVHARRLLKLSAPSLGGP
jgi:uncharacterized protein (DUF58 family)